MSLVIDPRAKRQHRAAYEAAIRDLRYGSVVVNHWGALSFGWSPPLGALTLDTR